MHRNLSDFMYQKSRGSLKILNYLLDNIWTAPSFDPFIRKVEFLYFKRVSLSISMRGIVLSFKISFTRQSYRFSILFSLFFYKTPGLYIKLFFKEGYLRIDLLSRHINFSKKIVETYDDFECSTNWAKKSSTSEKSYGNFMSQVFSGW